MSGNAVGRSWLEWPSLQTWLFVAMELSWIAALLILLDATAGRDAGPIFTIIALGYPLALVLDGGMRRLASRQWPWLAGHGVALAAFALIAFLLIAPSAIADWRAAGFRLDWLVEAAAGRQALIILSGAAFCWVRGTMLAGKRLDAHAVALGFQIGLLLLLLVLGIGQGLQHDQGALVSFGVGFVMFGLATLWHVRASTSPARTSTRDPISAIAGIAAVLVVGLLASAMVDRSVLDILLALLMRALETAGSFIVWLFSFLPEPDPEPFVLPEPEGGGAIPAAPREPVLRGPHWMRRIFSTIFFGTIALVLAIILLGNLRGLIAWLKKPRRLTPGLDFDRSNHSLADTLRQFWTRFVGILASALTALATLATRLRRRGTTRHTRRTYLRLLRDLDNRGWPRERHETPSDYARRMRGVWPGPGGDLALAGKLYDAQRYGDAADPPEGRFAKLRRKLRRSLNLVRYKEPEKYAQDGKRD